MRCFILCFIFIQVSGEPLDLGQLIDYGLQNHPATKEAWYQACSAKRGFEMKKSLYYPQADGVLGLCYGRFDETQYTHLELTASYLLLDFGGRKAEVSSAKETLIAAMSSRDRVVQGVLFGVLKAYYTHIEAKSAWQAKEQDLADATTNLEAAETLFTAGLTTRIDVLQAKSHLVNIQLQVERLKGITAVTVGELANAIGLDANVDLQVADLPETVGLDHISRSIDILVDSAKSKRPDVLASTANWHSKQEDLKSACSQGKPTLGATIDVHRNHHLHVCGDDRTNYSACLSVQVPLFHGYFYKNQQRKAAADVAIARAELAATTSNATLDVVTSYHSFKTAVETYRYSEEFLDFAEETYQAALVSYKEGVATILDLLATQSTLAKARSSLIQSRTQWLVALANLAYSTGELHA